MTLRAELSRLRRLLGADPLHSRPYRPAVPVDADFDTVARGLRSGAVTAALEAYAGPLLPGSRAPVPAIGRENHKMMLEHYQQTRNVLCSYIPQKLGFF